jgi:hypothetical protein
MSEHVATACGRYPQFYPQVVEISGESVAHSV